MRNTIVNTGFHQIWSAKLTTASPNFVPMTGPINSTMVATVRPSYELIGATGALTVRPAYRTSTDGIVWSSTITGIGSFRTTTGWVYDESTTPVDIGTDPNLFVQFGVQAANTTDSQVEMGQVNLRLEVAPTNGTTLTAGPAKVWSDGTTTQIFHPLAGRIPVEQISAYRGSFQMESNSGDAQTQMAYQVSNDGITWYSGVASAAADTFATFGTGRLTDGISYGTTFTSFAPAEAKQWVRFGIAVKNGTVGKSETCAANLRIDVRGS